MRKITQFIQKHALLLISSILIAVGVFAVSNNNDLKGKLQLPADEFFDVFCNIGDYSRDSFFDVFSDIQLRDNNYPDNPPLPDSFFDIFYSLENIYEPSDGFFDIEYKAQPLSSETPVGDSFFDIFCELPVYSVDSFFDVFYDLRLTDSTSDPVDLSVSFFDIFYDLEDCKDGDYKVDSFFDVFCEIGDYPSQQSFSNVLDSRNFRIDSFFDIFYNIDVGEFGIPAGDDSFSTPVPSTCEGIDPFNKLDFASNPIPADFFEPGSQPFTETVCLQGAEGGADTIVRRLDDMAFNDPFNGQGQVPIELVQLNLVSCEPITVSYNEAPPTYWNVEVSLSDTIKPQGTMTINHTCNEGGTFSSSFNVQPVFTFKRADESGNPIGDLNDPGKVIDPANPPLDGEGVSHTFRWNFSSPDTCWSHTASDHFPLLPTTSENFFPGICSNPCNGIDPVDPNSQSSQLFIWNSQQDLGPDQTTLAMLPANNAVGDLDNDGIPDVFDNNSNACNPDQTSYNIDSFFDIWCDGVDFPAGYLDTFCDNNTNPIFNTICEDSEAEIPDSLATVFCDDQPEFHIESFFDVWCDVNFTGLDEDCNTNSFPDECDISDFTPESEDCNTNSIPDECDVNSMVMNEICDENNIPDELDTFVEQVENKGHEVDSFLKAFIKIKGLDGDIEAFNFLDSFCQLTEPDSFFDVFCDQLSLNSIGDPDFDFAQGDPDFDLRTGDPDFDLLRIWTLLFDNNSQNTDEINFSDLLGNPDGPIDGVIVDGNPLILGSLFGHGITIPAGTSIDNGNNENWDFGAPTQIFNDGSADGTLPNPAVIMVQMGNTDTTFTFEPPVTVQLILKNTVCSPYGYTIVRKTSEGTYTSEGISDVSAEQVGDDCIITFKTNKMSTFGASSSSAPSGGGNADSYQGGNGGGGGYYKRRDVKKEQEKALEETLRFSATYKDVFPDYVNGEGRLHALKLFEAGIVKGHEDGTFRPYSSLTRFEVVKIALGLMGIEVNTAGDIDSPFPDVTYNNEMKAYIKKSKELGLVNGYPDGLFRPNQDITRAEAAKILFGTGGGSMRYSNPNTLTFRDVENIEWVKPYLQWGVDNSVLNNDIGYYPNRAITREEAITFAGRIFDLSK